MSESLTDFTTRVSKWHKLPSSLITSSAAQAIHSAVKTYSTRRPLERTAELTANAENEWALTSAVSGWADGYTVTGLLLEIGTGNLIPLDPNDYRVVRRVSADYLRLNGSACYTSAVDGIWLEYTMPHTVGATSGDTTIPVQDLDAVAKLAAAECLTMIANDTSDTTSSTLNATTVNYESVPDRFEKRAAKLVADYEAHMAARYPAGAVWAEWDGATAYGRTGLFHGQRRF